MTAVAWEPIRLALESELSPLCGTEKLHHTGLLLRMTHLKVKNDDTRENGQSQVAREIMLNQGMALAIIQSNRKAEYTSTDMRRLMEK